MTLTAVSCILRCSQPGGLSLAAAVKACNSRFRTTTVQFCKMTYKLGNQGIFACRLPHSTILCNKIDT